MGNDNELISDGPNLEFRDAIKHAEASILECDQTEIDPVHYFCDGLYAREITIPAGTVLTGKIHSKEHINIISKGKIAVATEAGYKEIEAPATIVSMPNTKRIGYAIEDTVWTTIHANPACTEDLEQLEQELIHSEYDMLTENKKEVLT
jgi:hypothetical protein